MNKETAIKVFEQKKIRSHWDEEQEKWYFSVVDVIQVLTESVDVAAYWRKLKQRLKQEGNETVTNLHGLKMLAEATTTEISKEKTPKTFIENKIIANQGGTIAGNTRKEIEKKTGKKVVTKHNAKNYLDSKKKLK